LMFVNNIAARQNVRSTTQFRLLEAPSQCEL
jgi:hypothetical protein